MNYPLTEFKLHDEVYFLAMRDNTPFIHKGKITTIVEIDQLNRRYTIEGDSFRCSLMDVQVYATKEELILELMGRKIIQ